MFTKEYQNQRLLTVLLMIIFIVISFQLLQNKSYFSYDELDTYTIANTSSDISSSPYGDTAFNQRILEQDILEAPYFYALASIYQYSAEIALDGLEASDIVKNPNTYKTATPSWRTQEYYKELLQPTKENSFHYSDVKSNCMLKGKTPLYYNIIHFFSSIIPSCSFKYIGFWSNAFFFFLGGLLLFHLSFRYFHSGWIGIAAALLFCFSIGGFSIILNTQPTMMILFFMISSLYLHLTFISKKEITSGYCQLFILNTILGLLTDYSFLLFSIGIAILYLITQICYRQWKYCFYYLLAFLTSTCISFFLYPISLLHLTTGWKLMMRDITVDSYFDNLQMMANSVKDSLLAKNSVIIGLIIFVLICTTILFRKTKLRKHIEEFQIRIYLKEYEDVFFGLLLTVYSFIIAFEKIDFQANTYFFLLPFYSLGICYVCYRLCHAVTKSTFNSGLILCMLCLLFCFIGYTSNTPDTLAISYDEELSFANANSGHYCIFVDSPNYSAGSHSLELAEYKHSLIVTEDNLKYIKKDKELKTQDSILVYVSNEHVVSGVLENIQKKGKFPYAKEVKAFSDGNAYLSHVYHLSRK